MNATVSAIPEQLWAVDWSGALSGSAQRRGIRAAVCERATGKLSLEPGQLRSEIEAHLLALAASSAPVVAGLDFSFSYPASFLQELGCRTAPELWARAAAEGERWLREPHPYFWGRRKGVGPPPGHRAPAWRGYRRCELALCAQGGVPAASNAARSRRLPSSSFQIGGAGAVGTGTLRGMPMLARLQAAGWSVWPFDTPRFPMLIEIYPRALTGPVRKSSAEARRVYLQQPRFHTLAPAARADAEASEDAFDALVSASVMGDHAASFTYLRQARDESERLEGAIWLPPQA